MLKLTNEEMAVQRGCALLDAKVPGWRERIDLEKFDLLVSCHCVLGQLYGEYSEGRKQMFAWDSCREDAVKHGFHYIIEVGLPFLLRPDKLNDAWYEDLYDHRNGISQEVEWKQ